MTIGEYLATNLVAFAITLGIFGLFIGSFLNVVIHRLPIMLNREWRQASREILAEELNLPEEDEQPAYNIVVPRSACPECGHKIRAWENIPIISYLFLGGKCSNCKTKISIRYPLVELTTGVLFLLCALEFGYTGATFFACVLSAILLCLTLIDIDTKLLPDNLVYVLLWTGLLANAMGIFTNLNAAVFGALFGYLSLWGIFWLFKLLTGKEGMGYGDFKLFAALGAWFGWMALLDIILLASVVGAVFGIVILWLQRKGRDTQIPFGPYLALGGMIYLFFGSVIVRNYLVYIGAV